uniref:SEFIR domain-containing protein n=1 Tax=Steinernema glaseri TaxID=37863 RepID=A0A1I7XXY7_9BILA
MEEDLASLTVAIELDNDVELDDDDDTDDFSGPSTSGLKGLVEISTPPSAASLVPPLPQNVKVKHLRSDARQLLQLRLDPHPLGSMRNWEFVANQLGLDNDRIINLQRRESPTEQLLSLFAEYPLAHLLSGIADSNRIDLLISLQPYIRGIQPHQERVPHQDAFALLDSGLLHSHSVSGFIADGLPEEPFVVVTHCSPRRTTERKSYKWFLENLKNAAVDSGVSIVDIDDFLKHDKELSDLELLFRKARHIIVVCSALYKQLMEGGEQAAADRLDRLKIYFHKKLLDAEYMELGRNERFRPVTIQGASHNVLLNGWQKNTIVHEFPTQFNELSARVFGPRRVPKE